MNYRRAQVAGGTYFFTHNLADRNNTLLVDEIDKLRSSINNVKKQHPFVLDAMVIMPEHLHALITLPQDDKDFATRWMLIKSGFSRAIPKTESVNTSRARREERGIWQRRYWEHLIRNDIDYARHVDYIHYNPVKHGYVKRATDWKYSTIHHYIAKGVIPSNWAYDDSGASDNFGER